LGSLLVSLAQGTSSPPDKTEVSSMRKRAKRRVRARVEVVVPLGIGLHLDLAVLAVPGEDERPAADEGEDPEELEEVGHSGGDLLPFSC